MFHGIESTGQLAKLVVFILKLEDRGSERLRPCQGHRTSEHTDDLCDPQADSLHCPRREVAVSLLTLTHSEKYLFHLD